MRRLSYILWLGFNLSFPQFGIGQNPTKADSLNQRTWLGQKDGIWVEYLDRSLQVVKSHKKAKYYQYVWYSKGSRLHSKLTTSKKVSEVKGAQTTKTDSLILLDGIYEIVYGDASAETKTADRFWFKKGYLQGVESRTKGILRTRIVHEPNFGTKTFQSTVTFFDLFGVCETRTVVTMFHNRRYKRQRIPCSN